MGKIDKRYVAFSTICKYRTGKQQARKPFEYDHK